MTYTAYIEIGGRIVDHISDIDASSEEEAREIARAQFEAFSLEILIDEEPTDEDDD